MTRDELSKISVRLVACLAGSLIGVFQSKTQLKPPAMRRVKSKYTTYVTFEFMKKKKKKLCEAAKSSDADHYHLTLFETLFSVMKTFHHLLY